MLTASIDQTRCDRQPGCPASRVCPRGAVVPIAASAPGARHGWTIDEKRCTGCGVCIRVCPMAAIQVREYVEETS